MSAVCSVSVPFLPGRPVNVIKAAHLKIAFWRHSTLQMLANCGSSLAQHMPRTQALHWLGIHTRGEAQHTWGEWHQETEIKRKKIKSDRQTGKEKPINRVRSVRDEGSGSQRMHECYKQRTGNKGFDFSLFAPTTASVWCSWQTGLFRDYRTFSNPRGSLSRGCVSGRNRFLTDRLGEETRRNKKCICRAPVGVKHTHTWSVFISWLPIWAESH